MGVCVCVCAKHTIYPKLIQKFSKKLFNVLFLANKKRMAQGVGIRLPWLLCPFFWSAMARSYFNKTEFDLIRSYFNKIFQNYKFKWIPTFNFNITKLDWIRRYFNKTEFDWIPTFYFRSPFGLFYHAAWFTQPHHKVGFETFLDTLVSMDDVWIVTRWIFDIT